MQRENNRDFQALREVRLKAGVIGNAAGSVEVCFGRTRVICTASLDTNLPPHALDKGTGWLTAEYGMLPASTHSRANREASRGKQGGRTLEIQRLIGRSLRAILDLKSIQGYAIWIDCDVIEADGGTRTASITGAYVALVQALEKLKAKFRWPTLPLLDQVAAVSVGIVGGEVLLDLDYREDANADVDMNLVMTSSGRFVEVQATAEKTPFHEEQLELMKKVGRAGLEKLFAKQRECLER